mgnify:CR=1 FL=1
MKFKITEDGLTPEVVEVETEAISSLALLDKNISPAIFISSDKDNILSSLIILIDRIKNYNDEHLYESLASDFTLNSFIDNIQKLRLWLDLRDYVDEVYSDKCVYLEWSYQFEHDRIRIVEIEAYDKDNIQMRVYPKAAILEIKWLQEINMDMLYAYRVRNWSRDNMNLGKT